MSEELRPCPFCGGEAELCYSEVDTFCRKCNVMQETELWNTRPIEDALRLRIAELEAEIERLTVHSDTERQDDKCSGHGDISNFPPVMGSGDGLGW